MIKLSIQSNDIQNLNKQLLMKVEAIGQMKKPIFLEEVAKAAFVIVGEKFMLATDRQAVRNPKSFHHVYEWKNLGNPRARLFVLNKTEMMNGSIAVSSKFLTSKVPVPIDPELLMPGNSGKFVNKRNIFRNKAQVMENGQPITYEAQRMLAFMGRNGLTFVRPGTVVHIQNPGGVSTKNAFSSFMLDWYNSNAQSIMDSSGLYEKIVNDTSVVLSKNNTNAKDVQKVVQDIVNTISGGKVEIQ